MPAKIEQQLKQNDCGICAVKTIYNLHQIPVSRAYLDEHLHLDEQGIDLQEIRDYFDRHQFPTTYNLLDLNFLKFNAQKLAEFTPCILPVKTPQGLHYVVIRGLAGKKIVVLDPANGTVEKWTFPQLMNNAHTATTCYDWVSSKDLFEHIIREELAPYGLDPESLPPADPATVINKLTYFSYLKEHFGFSGPPAEKAFLEDLLYQQELGPLPAQFRALKVAGSRLQVKAPVVLTVKPPAITAPAATPRPAEAPLNPYKRLYRELRQYHGLWGIYITAALVAALFAQLTVFSNQILIDNVLPAFNTNLLVLFAVGLGLFKLFNLALSLYKSFISIHLSNILDHHFLSTFSERLNNFPIRYIHAFSKGDLSERLKDSLALKTFFMSFCTNVLIDGFITLYSLVILFLINWKVTLIVLGVLVLFTIWFTVITPYIREYEKARFLEKSNLFSGLFENIEGLQVIKSFRLETLFVQRLAPRIKNLLRISMKMKYVGLVNSAVTSVIGTAAGLLVLVVLTHGAITGQNVPGGQGISMGQILTFLSLTYQVLSGVGSLLDQNLNLQENSIILNRYYDFNKNQEGAATPALHKKIQDFTIETLEFRNLSFQYVPQKPVFTNLELTLKKGERIRLDGGNGTGKSTFCKVLSLLYPPDGGDILVNGQKWQFYNQSQLREKILLVSNEDVLFNDTAGFNITFSHQADAGPVLTLAKELGLYDFLTSQGEGLDFIINEQGRNLSTGQRKKILLMRALFSGAEIILLDEVLAGIDRESREKIERFINTQSDKTFIVISHEPLFHLQFNTTLIMNNGRLEQLHYQGI
ncbi:ATP-binding cassette domain-containing protein [Paraflavisolibacter sp. H34]|uniref:ATP-binding cassette domain-containing protein n=1 Tax=Huijunlia imazamoxiresistens TaxID=3127457 RepID=UPI003015C861